MSEPGHAAAPLPPPLPPALPAPAANPWPGMLLDVLLGGVGLLVISIVLITPLMLIGLFQMPEPAREAAAADPDLLMRGMLAEITVAAIASTLLAAGLVWALRGRRLAPPVPAMAPWPAMGLALVAGLVIQGLAIGLLNGLLSRHGAEGAQPSNVEPILALQDAWPVLNAFLVVVVAPFAEELLFRRILLHRFVVAGRRLSGLVVTSLLFACMHEVGQGGQNSLLQWLGLMTVYTAMGLGFGLVYLRTGRFAPTVLAHAACNATALAVMAFSAG